MAKKWNIRLPRAAKPMRAVALCCGLASAAFMGTYTAPAIAGLWPRLVTGNATSDTAKTRHPIVLVHGLLGFDTLLGVDYFYDIPRNLAGAGATVFVPQVSGSNTSEVRGEQLLLELKILHALAGGSPEIKFNLIGHSQGSPTARYVAAVAPELVASVTSVGGANGGAKLADQFVAFEGNFFQDLALTAVGFLTNVIGTLSGKDPWLMPEVPRSAMRSLSTAGSKAFNEKYPAGRPPAGSSCDVKSGESVVNGVRYYSWSGVSTDFSLFDLSDLPLKMLGDLFYWNEPNDGLLATCSTRLGEHLGDYRQNHLDEVNQGFGNTYGSRFPYYEKSPLVLFKEHAARLKSAGL